LPGATGAPCALHNRMGACAMTDDTEDEPIGSPAFQAALAAVEEYGRADPAERKRRMRELEALLGIEGRDEAAN